VRKTATEEAKTAIGALHETTTGEDAVVATTTAEETDEPLSKA